MQLLVLLMISEIRMTDGNVYCETTKMQQQDSAKITFEQLYEHMEIGDKS